MIEDEDDDDDDDEGDEDDAEGMCPLLSPNDYPFSLFCTEAYCH